MVRFGAIVAKPKDRERERVRVRVRERERERERGGQNEKSMRENALLEFLISSSFKPDLVKKPNVPI